MEALPAQLQVSRASCGSGAVGLCTAQGLPAEVGSFPSPSHGLQSGSWTARLPFAFLPSLLPSLPSSPLPKDLFFLGGSCMVLAGQEHLLPYQPHSLQPVMGRLRLASSTQWGFVKALVRSEVPRRPPWAVVSEHQAGRTGGFPLTCTEREAGRWRGHGLHETCRHGWK